jgi:putative transposase
LAGRVLLKILYLLTCRVLSVAVMVFRGDRVQAAELLVLRHENAVLRCHIGCVRYEPADRAWVRRAGSAHSPQALDKDLTDA